MVYPTFLNRNGGENLFLSTPIVTRAVFTLFLLTLLVSLHRAWKGPIAHLPGPWYSRFTGLWLKYKVLTGQRSRYLHRIHNIYGGIVRVSPSEVSIADLEASREIFKASGGYLKTEFFKNISPQDQDTIFSAISPSVHARFRRVLGSAMTESSVKNLHLVIREHAQMLVSQLLKEQANLGYFDWLKWSCLFAQDVVATASFGHSFRTLELGKNTQYLEDLKTCVSMGSILVQFVGVPAWKLPSLPIWPIRKINNARKRTEAQAAEMIAAYRNTQKSESSAASSHTMLFSHLLGEKGRNMEFSEKEIVQAAQGNLLAGTDSTGHTLTYLLFCLIKNPDTMSKLRAELKQLPENPMHEELKACAYLENCIEEALRLHGGVMTSLPRCVPPGGRNLGGYFIPERTVVSPIGYVLHRDPILYPEPEAFRPERWEGATKDMKDAMITFGAGIRVCLGMHMARMEMRAAIFELLRRAPSLHLATGKTGFSENDMEMLDFFVTLPKGGKCLLSTSPATEHYA